MPSRAPRRGVVAALLLLACSGDPTGPSAGGAQYFRLVAVNDRPLPATTTPRIGGAGALITHGDLVLRADGTFTLGIVEPDHGFGLVLDGRAATDGDALHLDVAPSAPGVPSARLSGTRRGARIVMSLATQAGPIAYAYEPVAGWRPEAGHGYVLSAVDGRADRTTEWTVAGDRFVHRIVYDSLRFTDGVFFRRHRATRHVTYLARGDSLVSTDEWTMSGSYVEGSAWRLLRAYPSAAEAPARDSLVVAGDALVRRTGEYAPGTSDIVVREDRYERRP